MRFGVVPRVAMRVTMRVTVRVILGVLCGIAWLGTTQPARAASGCDLDEVVGYHLVQKKTIEAFIDGGRRQFGYQCCAPGRVLIFTDHTGVRCRDTVVQRLDIPVAYLFARSESDMKLCVGDQMLGVVPAR